MRLVFKLYQKPFADQQKSYSVSPIMIVPFVYKTIATCLSAKQLRKGIFIRLHYTLV